MGVQWNIWRQVCNYVSFHLSDYLHEDDQKWPRKEVRNLKIQSPPGHQLPTKEKVCNCWYRDIMCNIWRLWCKYIFSSEVLPAMKISKKHKIHKKWHKKPTITSASTRSSHAKREKTTIYSTWMHCATYEFICTYISSNSRHYMHKNYCVGLLHCVDDSRWRTIISQALYGVQKWFKACSRTIWVQVMMCSTYRPIGECLN